MTSIIGVRFGAARREDMAASLVFSSS